MTNGASPGWERPVRVSGTQAVGFDGIRAPAGRVIAHPLGRLKNRLSRG